MISALENQARQGKNDGKVQKGSGLFVSQNAYALGSVAAHK